AVARAARIRLRPIMMTSVATVAGHFPLTLVTGAGAAARNSIGLVLVGGMTVGTIFTLFIVPSLYMLIAKEHREKSLMDVGWKARPKRWILRRKWHLRLRQKGTATVGNRRDLTLCGRASALRRKNKASAGFPTEAFGSSPTFLRFPILAHFSARARHSGC